MNWSCIPYIDLASLLNGLTMSFVQTLYPLSVNWSHVLLNKTCTLKQNLYLQTWFIPLNLIATPRGEQKTQKKLTEKTEPWKKPIRIFRKTSGSVWFGFSFVMLKLINPNLTKLIQIKKKRFYKYPSHRHATQPTPHFLNPHITHNSQVHTQFFVLQSSLISFHNLH